ncbi:hypothetical protein IVB46_41865 [Bradyrhizobium sp. 61]|uniref:hypothetical protein n=1 Tax=Bradyrhizobium sp. 61 TaxID=2782679 RepID=UPI001FF8E4FF|nr:hypothetical protein [Bradyrhizobium sp. 61]MCK1281782.1 hypothetical protein [Bradyrhizobium sp. 61]
MSLQLDPQTGVITYKGEKIGEHTFKDGQSTVRVNIEYSTAGEWILPLSGLATGLSQLPENQPAKPALTIETREVAIDKEFDVPRLLVEKLVKRNGHIWDFHKTDVDPWPSRLHGHDYEKGLKLDAITGDIYDVATRARCKTLKKRELKYLQTQLRECKDFKDIVTELVDNPRIEAERVKEG